MKKKVTLENLSVKIGDLAGLIKQANTKINSRFDSIDKKLDSHDKRFDYIDEKFDGLTEVMIKRFESIDSEFREEKESLDQIKFNTSGQERRVSILEEKVRMLGIKVGLSYKN